MPTMNGQDDALFGLIAAKQWKQAFKACEKKLRLTPKSDYLLVTKISILLQWPDQARFAQGLQELNALIDRKPPVADIEALRALDTVFEYLEPLTDLAPKQKQTWQRAAVSRPQDEKLHEVWYWTKFDQLDFQGAQQASLTWMKHFPKERRPFFLYILNTHKVSEQDTSEQQKALQQTLAYRTLSKAAADKQKSNGESNGMGREISSFEDLSLLIRIYRAQERYTELDEIFTDQRVGFNAYNGGIKWELVGQYMELLNLQQRWAQLREMCIAILKRCRDISFEDTTLSFGKLGNDWKIWQMLVSASAKHDPITDSAETEGLIRSFCSDSKNSSERNARLALLFFYATETLDGRRSQDDLLSALTDYFQVFSAKYVSFSDVERWLPYLNIERQKRLLVDTAKISQDAQPPSGDSESSMIYWITREINVLKLEYNIVISQDHNSHHADLLTAFIRNCIRLYKQSLELGIDLPVSDRRPGDDAALLAAMGLIRLFKLGRKRALLQSIVVLEHTILYSKHNYDALLILVSLYIFLGAGSLAMERYSRLSIKNIQYATVSWLLYTRISSIHPYPATYTTNGKKQSTFDPLEDMVHASKWHTSAEVLSQKAVHAMQANGQWNMSLDALATNQAVSNGFSKFLILVESRRIARLRSHTHEVPQEVIRIPEQMKDQRDRDAFPDFEGGSLPFEQHLPKAGTSIEPNDAWLYHQLSLASFWEILHNNGGSQLRREELKALKENSKGEPDALTRQEQATAYLVSGLESLYTLYSQKLRYEKEAGNLFIQELFENIEKWLAESCEGLVLVTAPLALTPDLSVPLWSLFHDLFNHLDLCKFIIPTLEFAVSENKKQARVGHVWLVDRVEALRKECTKLGESVSRAANKLRDKLNDHTTPQQIEEVVLGGLDKTEDQDVIAGELRDLGDYVELRKMCQDIRDSWIDGLEGVIRTKIV